MTEIKICGLTKKEEADILIEERVEYAGIVLEYKKSKRNNSIDEAAVLIEHFNRKDRGFSVKTVAVTVSPTLSMLEKVKEIGFDFIQIHGTLDEEILQKITIPLFRAVSIDQLEEIERAKRHPKVTALLYDGVISGSGEVFDWGELIYDKRKRDGNEKMCILAGGLDAANVEQAVKMVKPHVVDVSSGVEYDKHTVGKDPVKIRQFIKAVRSINLEKN